MRHNKDKSSVTIRSVLNGIVLFSGHIVLSCTKNAIIFCKRSINDHKLFKLIRQFFSRPYKSIVVENLFPRRAEHTHPVMVLPENVREAEDSVPLVTKPEMRAAVAPMRAKTTAPGPDGIPNRVLALVLEHLATRQDCTTFF